MLKISEVSGYISYFNSECSKDGNIHDQANGFYASCLVWAGCCDYCVGCVLPSVSNTVTLCATMQATKQCAWSYMDAFIGNIGSKSTSSNHHFHLQCTRSNIDLFSQRCPRKTIGLFARLLISKKLDNKIYSWNYTNNSRALPVLLRYGPVSGPWLWLRLLMGPLLW